MSLPRFGSRVDRFLASPGMDSSTCPTPLPREWAFPGCGAGVGCRQGDSRQMVSSPPPHPLHSPGSRPTLQVTQPTLRLSHAPLQTPHGGVQMVSPAPRNWARVAPDTERPGKRRPGRAHSTACVGEAKVARARRLLLPGQSKGRFRGVPAGRSIVPGGGRVGVAGGAASGGDSRGRTAGEAAAR